MKNLIKSFAIKYVIIFSLIITDVMSQNSKNDNSLLWKISGNGLKNDSYILLTTNSLCKNSPLNGKLTVALNNVQYVCYEQGGLDPKNKSKVQGLVMVNDEKHAIKSNLSSSVYNSLVDRATEAGIDEITLNKIKPVFLVSTIINKTILECNSSNVKSYENYIRDYAKQKKLKQGELYSLNEYAGLFDGYDKAFWDKTVGFLMNNSGKMLTDFEAKETFYSQENLNGIKALYNSNVFWNTRFLYTDAETARMKLCASRLEVIMKEQSTLFLLDVSNVVNSKMSLFSLLNKMGYELNPVSNNL